MQIKRDIDERNHEIIHENLEEKWKIFKEIINQVASKESGFMVLYNKYKEARRILKYKEKYAKNKEWKDFGKRMEADSKNNLKLFYKDLRNMKGDMRKT